MTSPRLEPGRWPCVYQGCGRWWCGSGRAGRVGGVVAHHEAVDHGSPLAPEAVVWAHRASRLTTRRVWTCWAAYRAWVVQGDVWEGVMVQPSPCEVVPQTGRKAAAGGPPYLGHSHEVTAAGGPSRPHRQVVAPVAPARPSKPRARGPPTASPR